ncbi:hypothetical protein WICMUC_000027 [Wickerhamomyces mucosus]|uniref:SHSP domain-containing protein n=1 Tax=Wickerhamomyces mucosus TaxID=1378264 RepID=A0A9P8TJ97_9ASCO|nr:hypothetical protein WICMUC_000027 [Wickerhamomyces mucosus]
MSYFNPTIEELLGALSNSRSPNPYQQRYHQYQQQQQLERERQRRTEEQQARAYAAALANRYHFQHDDDDDDESDDYYYYPNYYQHPFFQPPSKRQIQPHSDTFDLADVLKYLSGKEESGEQEAAADASDRSPVEKPKDSINDEVVKQGTELNDDEKLKHKEKTKEPQKPILGLKRHSTFNKDSGPKPKVEISSRNLKNENLPYSPQTNVYDLPEEYVLLLSIPGANLKDLSIDFHPSTNEIVVQGEIPSPFDTDVSNIKNLEIRSGSIERRVKFPNLPKINDENIKAKYLNGLLTIKVPKKKGLETKGKKRVSIEDVPDEELIFEERGGL